MGLRDSDAGAELGHRRRPEEPIPVAGGSRPHCLLSRQRRAQVGPDGGPGRGRRARDGEGQGDKGHADEGYLQRTRAILYGAAARLKAALRTALKTRQRIESDQLWRGRRPEVRGRMLL